MALTKRPPFTGRFWAQDGERADPGAKYEQGWVHGEKPEHGHQNFLQYNMEQVFINNIQDGIPYWNSKLNYVKGAVCKFEDHIYVAQEANTNQLPSGGKWEISFGCDSLVDAQSYLREVYDLYRAHVIDYNNPHKVTADQADTYIKSIFDAKKLQLTQDLEAHKVDYSNPHNTTYTQLGILPKAGGTMDWFHTKSGVFGLGTSALALSGDYTFLLKSGNKAIGLDSKDPQVFVGTEIERLTHEGNFKTLRNELQPKYSLPTPDFEAKLTQDIATTSHCIIDVPWEPVFSSDGIKLEGRATFEDSQDIVGVLQTMSCTVKGVAKLVVGRTVIDSNGTNIVVADGDTTIYSKAGTSGHIIYVREDGKGIVYLNHIKVAEVNHDERPTQAQGWIEGSGHIRDIKIWAGTLAAEQVTKIK